MPASVNPERHPTSSAAIAEAGTIAGARCLGRQRLQGLSNTPVLDADILLQYATGYSRTALITRSTEPLEPDLAQRYLVLLDRRAGGEPVAYIVGKKHFRSIELTVDRRVLVPRPETELLVEVGLAVLAMMAGERRVIDVGTGTGAIALALAGELPERRYVEVEVMASDISHEALQVAASNRHDLGVDARVELVESDLLERVDGIFDLILANLPYLHEDQRHPTISSEPERALFAGPDGLDQYRRLLPQAAWRLTPGGVLACEIDPSQAEAMRALAGEDINGEIAVFQDLAGHARIVVAGDVDIVRTVADTWRYGA